MKYLFIFMLIVFPYLFGFLWSEIENSMGSSDPYGEITEEQDQ